MRILALDSSGLVASVAIVAGADGKADAQTIGEYTMNYKKTHSQALDLRLRIDCLDCFFETRKTV